MSKTPRLYLFHGNDSRASSRAVRRWEDVFRQKYGEATRYSIEADELTPEQLGRRLQEVLEGSTLFVEPKLVIVKRLTTSEKGNSAPYSKVVIPYLNKVLPNLDDAVTVAIWEERQLPATHPLSKAFSEWANKKVATINLFSAPAVREVVALARSYVAEQEHSLSNEAERWLVERYQQQEKAARLAKRLRSTEALLEDDRMWWLYQLLDGAMLRAHSSEITRADLSEGSMTAVQAVGVFEIVNALGDHNWSLSRALLRRWEEAYTDESSYFGLYALLRVQYQKRGDQFALKLLAELEIIVKNFTLPPSWLMELLVVRLEQASRGEKKSLLPPRKLWLAQLHRS